MRPAATAKRIHIFGASGSGTSTLGYALAQRLDLTFFDVDDFFWQPTDPPYQRARERLLRQTMLADAVGGANGWTLSGSLCGWGDGIIPLFDMAVFVVTPPAIRMSRLREREARRFGQRLAPGGDMHANHKEFIEWAAGYDDGSIETRSLKLHEDWLERLPCPVLRVDGSRSLDDLCDEVIRGS